MSVRFRPPAPQLHPSLRRRLQPPVIHVNVRVPLLWRPPVRKPVLHAPEPGRLRRGPFQSQSRFAGRASSLVPVARHATRHDVRPVRAAAARARDHVVARELAGGWTRAAILASKIIPGVDVAAGKLRFAAAKANERGEADDRGHGDAFGNRAHFPIGNLDDLGLLEDDELHRSTPANHVERFKRGIQQQYVFEEILTPRKIWRKPSSMLPDVLKKSQPHPHGTAPIWALTSPRVLVWSACCVVIPPAPADLRRRSCRQSGECPDGRRRTSWQRARWAGHRGTRHRSDRARDLHLRRSPAS
jgi:hypothetical protein